MKRPLIHIGYEKTGTTWVQRYVFRNPELGFAVAVKNQGIKTRIIKPHDLLFDAEALRAQFVPRVEAVADQGLVPVLSAERLSGDANLRAYDNVRNADRLAALFPEAKILIVVREQKAAILATYKQYVGAGGRLSLAEYLNGGGPTLQWPFELAQCAYDPLIAHYQRRFGKEQVLVLPYELFQRDGRDFVARIVRFAEAPADPATLDGLPFSHRANPSRRAVAVAVKRRLNVVLRQRLTPWGRIDPHGRAGRRLLQATWRICDLVPAGLNARLERAMRAAVASAVGDFYQESNARTSKLIGIDLGAYGYDVPRTTVAPATRSSAASQAVPE